MLEPIPSLGYKSLGMNLMTGAVEYATEDDSWVQFMIVASAYFLLIAVNIVLYDTDILEISKALKLSCEQSC